MPTPGSTCILLTHDVIDDIFAHAATNYVLLGTLCRALCHVTRCPGFYICTPKHTRGVDQERTGLGSQVLTWLPLAPTISRHT